MNYLVYRQSPIHFRYLSQTKPYTQPNSHLDYEILYFHDGERKYSIGEYTFDMKPGDLLLMNGLTLHGPAAGHSAPYSRTVFHFDPAYIAQLSASPYTVDVLRPFREWGNAKISLSADHKAHFERQLAELHQLSRGQDPAAYCRFQVLFLDLLFVIAGFYAEAAGSGGDSQIRFTWAKDLHARELIRYLEVHYTRDIDLPHLEAQLHVNKFNLSKSFKENTGMTIFQYVMEKRIRHAKASLLLRADRSVAEIASESGFKHPSHFCRVFKQHTGCTPDNYRKTNGLRLEKE